MAPARIGSLAASRTPDEWLVRCRCTGSRKGKGSVGHRQSTGPPRSPAELSCHQLRAGNAKGRRRHEQHGLECRQDGV